jgi:phosphopantetheine--protein transferase-like protein
MSLRRQEIFVILGIGTDVIEICRVEGLLGKKGFKDRFFTPVEMEYLSAKRAESAAGYFCAKEAVVKALGTGFSGIRWRDVEIIKINSVPNVILHGRALEIANDKGVKKIFLSISHCRDYAVATAVMEG